MMGMALVSWAGIGRQETREGQVRQATRGRITASNAVMKGGWSPNHPLEVAPWKKAQLFTLITNSTTAKAAT